MTDFTTKPRTARHRLPVFAPEQKAKVRADCIKGTHATGSMAERMAGQRDCLQMACRHNLIWIDSDDMAGRRHDGLAPEGTMRGTTSAGSPSCSLDVASTGPKTAREIGRAMGMTTRAVEMWLKDAKEGRGGVELARLVSALMGDE